MKKYKTYVMGICFISAIVGMGLGYFIFGSMLGKNTEVNAEEYTPFSKYIPDEEPEIVLAYSDISIMPAEITPPAPEPSHLFVVTSRDGYITVYHAAIDGTGEIKEVTSIKTNALPLIEQQRLAQGINIYTEEALIRILEDYGS